MYYILDNAGNLSKRSFKNDFAALYYFTQHWQDYVVSVLHNDCISVYNENKMNILNINPNTGVSEMTKYFSVV